MILTRALSNDFSIASSALIKTANRSAVRTAFAAVAVLLATSTLVHSATINYGTFNVPAAGIMFQNVSESSGTDAVPMYGPPEPYNIGMDFDPANFTSSSGGGSADTTDGQLNFTIMGLVNANGYVGITHFNVFEAGDYTLFGAGGAGTGVAAGAIARATITQVNGLPVAPITLAPINASFGDSLPGSVVVGPWSLGLFYNLSAGLPSGQVATKVEVAINNTLATSSEAGSTAFIAKKDFRIDLSTDVFGNPMVPEPTTLVLTALSGVVALAFRRGRA